tara:strand:+ start:1160 stop:1279 length:120 start_codon:yes stop_codon:yes gene_type:complete
MTDYNKDAVEKTIQKDKTISKKDAKLIHALLRGHQKQNF